MNKIIQKGCLSGYTPKQLLIIYGATIIVGLSVYISTGFYLLSGVIGCLIGGPLIIHYTDKNKKESNNER